MASERLNEYFFTVGPMLEPLVALDSSAQDEVDGYPLQLRWRAELLDRFPMEDSKDTRIENGISDFCFPNGLKFSRGIQMPKFFCFVLTNGEGDRTYGNCLITYELVPPETEAQFESLVEAWQGRQAERDAKALKEQAAAAVAVALPVSTNGGPGIGRAQSQAEAMATPVSDSPIPPPSTEELVLSTDGEGTASPRNGGGGGANQGLYAPKCLCLLSKYPFIESSRAWLMQLYRLSLSPTQIPIERYICNFLLEVPCPVPGKVDIQYTMLDQVIMYPSPPRNQPLAWSGISFEPILEWISPENLLLIFNHVLLEQQVLLHSSQLSLLTACLEVITACLYPLQWCHVYIPVLPRHCLYIPTNSPVPFLLGFPTESYKTIASQLPDTVVVVDLDKNTVTAPADAICPPLPERRRSKLLKALKEGANLFEIRERYWPHRSINNLDDPFTHSGLPFELLDDFSSGLSSAAAKVDWDVVRDAFLSFFIALMKDYRKYMIYPTKENPRPRTVFKQHEFVSSHPVEWSPFLEAFCQTQAFQSFIDARLQPDPEDTDIAFFDEAIDSKNNRSRFSMSMTRRHPSFHRPKHQGFVEEVKTVVALQPDVTGLPNEPFVYNGCFPPLQERWFSPPRPVNELAEYGQGLSKFSGRRGNNKKKRNNIFRFKSDHVPLDPATLVFSTFIMAYSPTIGRELHEAGGGDKGRGGDIGRPVSSLDGSMVRRDSLSAAVALRSMSLENSEGGGGKGSRTAAPPVVAEGEPSATDPKGLPGHESSEDVEALVARGGSVDGITSTATAPVAGSSDDLANAGSFSLNSSISTKPQSFRLRPKMRRLSEDLKEERLHAANGKLNMAFDVLQRMKGQNTLADEWIYRSLIDASSRLGNVELAMKALMEMNEAGFMPDASVMSCLIAAFAMNDKNSSSSSSQVAQNLALLDWNKIRRSGGKDAGQRMKLDVRLSMSMTTTPKVFKDAFSAFRKIGTPSVNSNLWGISSPGNHSSSGGAGNRLSMSHYYHESAAASSSARQHTTNGGGGHENGSSMIKTTRSDSGMQGAMSSTTTSAWDLQLDESALRDAEREAESTSSRPKSMKQFSSMMHNSSVVKYQVLYGESLLEMLFPSLVLDVDSETCPDCNAKLSSIQIQMGWLADPNNYTTQCPLCAAVKEAPQREESTNIDASVSRASESSVASSTTADTSRRRQSVRPSLNHRRFVARFSVHSSAPDWVGSMGPGTPLWCEYLSPWVLRKEVQTILLNDGIGSLISPGFRKTSQASATIFWNLTLWFREYSLPVSFLLQDSVQGASANFSAPY